MISWVRCLFFVIMIERNFVCCFLGILWLFSMILDSVLMEVMGVCSLWVMVVIKLALRWFSFLSCLLVCLSCRVVCLSLADFFFSVLLYFIIFLVCLSILNIFFRLMGFFLVMEFMMIFVEVALIVLVRWVFV